MRGATKVLEKFKLLGFEEGAELVTPEPVKQRFNGIF
jgi:hypothetical protein